MRLGRRRQGEDADRLRAAYRVAADAGDQAEAERLAWAVVDADPSDRVFWFDLGLFAKRRRDWDGSARLNARALEGARPDREGDPAAWNMGIAATALGDWALARRGWRAYGIDVPDGDGPLQMRLGMVPVRLNPDDTDLGAEPLEIDGVVHDVEVVWTERLSPAHARVVSVPLPESGHRFGDVVLIDGSPLGERFDGRSWVPVFNELALLARSPLTTWTVQVEAAEPADAQALAELAESRGIGAEDWTAGFQVLCKACSEGRPGAHDHGQQDRPWQATRRFGVAGSADDVREVLEHWAAAGPGGGPGERDGYEP
jgi:hypothetical protein